MTRNMASFGVLAVVSLATLACGTGDSAVTAPTSTPVSTTTTTTQTTNPPTGPVPTLPAVLFGYSDATSPLPAWFLGNGPGGAVIAGDNTPATNPTTDAGATLGRVLFYDTRLSSTNTISCGSCHIQSLGFGDTARFSTGVAGVSARHTMALANARFYSRGKFFWDERAATLEDQVLIPIQNPVEMGETLDGIVAKVGAASFYPALFQAAFGSSQISSSAISLALAQYVRSLVSSNSKFDKALVGAGPPNFAGFTAQEQQGQALFTGPAGCAACHATNAQVLDNIHDTGLDSTITDIGTGNGSFKAPSLRNVGLRASFMHDGRFQTLQQVVAFYDSGVQPNPNLDRRLQNANGTPRRLNLTQPQRDALVAFLNTLTDSTYITAAKFSNPFPRP
jgi:cytochrome c peroxidase